MLITATTTVKSANFRTFFASERVLPARTCSPCFPIIHPIYGVPLCIPSSDSTLVRFAPIQSFFEADKWCSSNRYWFCRRRDTRIQTTRFLTRMSPVFHTLDTTLTQTWLTLQLVSSFHQNSIAGPYSSGCGLIVRVVAMIHDALWWWWTRSFVNMVNAHHYYCTTITYTHTRTASVPTTRQAKPVSQPTGLVS